MGARRPRADRVPSVRRTSSPSPPVPMLDRAETLRLVEHASTLSERIAAARTRRTGACGAGNAGTTADHDPAAEAAWRRWIDRVAEGDAERFAHRLAWDDVRPEMAPELLRAVRPEPGDALPEWATLLHEVLDAVHAADLTTMDRACDGAAPAPFEQIVVPFVVAARARLGRRAPALLALLADDAHRALERTLLRHLSYCFDQTLGAEL